MIAALALTIALVTPSHGRTLFEDGSGTLADGRTFCVPAGTCSVDDADVRAPRWARVAYRCAMADGEWAQGEWREC